MANDRLTDEVKSKIRFIACRYASSSDSKQPQTVIAEYIFTLFKEHLPDFKKSLSKVEQSKFEDFFRKTTGISTGNLLGVFISGDRGVSKHLREYIFFLLSKYKSELTDWQIGWDNRKSKSVNGRPKNPNYHSMDKFVLFFGIRDYTIEIVYGLFELDENTAYKSTTDSTGQPTRRPIIYRGPVTGESTIASIAAIFEKLHDVDKIKFVLNNDNHGNSFTHKTTVISLGGSASCNFTKNLLDRNSTSPHPSKPRNVFFDFHWEESTGEWDLLDLTKKNIFKIERPPDGIEYSIIEKLTSTVSGDRFFVCAGLKRQGTEIAVRYLFDHWERLFGLLGDDDFGILIKCATDNKTNPQELYVCQKTRAGVEIKLEEKQIKRTAFDF